tara:strand:+ start:309 stop:692 length:384 start_codon:yes stop_codon:yes gene_type:complete
MPTFHGFEGNFNPFNVGIDAPVVFGNVLLRTSGISPLTLLKTSFIIFALNCSLVTYLYPKYDAPRVLVISTNEAILKMLEIFWNMIYSAIIRACSMMSIVVLLFIVALSPLYVTMGLMTRQLHEKVK